MSDINYDPACRDCRRDAGKDNAGTTWQCWPHIKRERDEARAEIERLREVHLRGCECAVTEACQLLRERDEAVALLRDVAQSGVAWTTRDYVVAQIDKATWDAMHKIGGTR